jgi:ribosomal subunit interface protein
MGLIPEEYAMHVDIRAGKLEVDEALRVHVDRRLRFALGRFGERIAKVTVRFEDANGARGGVDKQCHIDISLRPSGNVLVEDIDADLHAVVDRAADRAARAVDRDLQRRRDARRP